MKITYGEHVDYEGVQETEVDLEKDDPTYIEHVMKRLARDDIFLIEYPEVTAKKVGKEWFQVFQAEKERQEEITANRKIAAAKAAATRKKKLLEKYAKKQDGDNPFVCENGGGRPVDFG